MPWNGVLGGAAFHIQSRANQASYILSAKKFKKNLSRLL